MAPRLELPWRMSSRFWPRITLAVAAIASIATSQAPEGWNVQSSAPITLVTLDREHPKATFAIHTDVTGTGPYTDLYGYVTTYLHVRATGTFTTQPILRITLRSLTDPTQVSVEDRVLPNTSSEAWGDIAVFGLCATPPCTEEVELIAELVNADGLTVEIDGTIQVSASGDNYDLERTTQVAITASLLP
jgi:hypothetical protein